MKRLTVLAATVALLAAPILAAPAQAHQPPGDQHRHRHSPPVTVMTRNIYLGADITRPLRAVAGLEGAAALVALGNANHEVADIVDQTSFPTRSRLLAKEIKQTRPDLIGLQEVALWRTGPLELSTDALGDLNATEVRYDYLKILLRALRHAGAPYRAVQVQQESDVEAPSFLGNPFTGAGFADGSDERITMRDVILKRVGSKVRILDAGGANYQARLDLSIGGLPASFIRGYNWVDARAGHRQFRFINTHLEAFSSTLALFQAQELLAGPANHDGNTIIVCDCNSDPLSTATDPNDPLSTPHNAPYNAIVAAGFFDQWLRWAPAAEGWTSGLSELVDDSTPAGFDHRIDMVFAHNANGDPLKVVRGEVTGNELSDRDPGSGLWPSDHAGVVLELRGLR